MSDVITSATATARYVRVTPMKARRVIDLVRGKSVSEALAILKYAPQAAAKPVAKVVASAAANAENNFGLNPRIGYLRGIRQRRTNYASFPTACSGSCVHDPQAHQPHHCGSRKPGRRCQVNG